MSLADPGFREHWLGRETMQTMAPAVFRRRAAPLEQGCRHSMRGRVILRVMTLLRRPR